MHLLHQNHAFFIFNTSTVAVSISNYSVPLTQLLLTTQGQGKTTVLLFANNKNGDNS